MRSNRISARSWLLALYIVTILVVAIGKAYGHRGPDNNFLIFRWSFLNLSSGLDMYAAQPSHHTDLFKYSPSFAILFAPFALLPFSLSLALWDALNALLLFFAVDKLLPGKQAAIALALIYLEMLRSMQRTQSNALVTALVILAYIAFEHRRQAGAAFAIAIGAAVKIFPLAALALAIFYRRRVRFALWMALAMLVVLALPLLVVSPGGLAAQYQSWRAVEAVDALSVGGGGGGGLYGGLMQQLRLIFGVSWPNWPVQLAGTVVLMLPLARWRNWASPDFRLRFLCALLVYMVIFNHQSESPSFVIAVTGIAIWFVTVPHSWWHTTVMVLTILVVSISSTDITPKSWQRDFFVHYRLKTIPCTLAWLTMMWELLTFRPSKTSETHERLWEGFVLEGARDTVYFAGDTGWGRMYGELHERWSRFTLALLPVSPFKPRWYMARKHLGPEDALRAAIETRSATVIPIHWGTFELGDDSESEAVDSLRASVAALPSRCRPGLSILRNGESATLEPLSESDSLTLSTICLRAR